MTQEEFSRLKPGDLVQNLGSGNSYIIAEVLHERSVSSSSAITRVIATRTLELSNPHEWKLVPKGAPDGEGSDNRQHSKC
jgi:hypothetical protein